MSQLHARIHSIALHEAEDWNEKFSVYLKSKSKLNAAHQNYFWRVSDLECVEVLRGWLNAGSTNLCEMGCGPGIRSFMLAETIEHSSLTLVDVSRNALEAAKRFAPQHLSVRYLHQNLIELNEPESFDLVWSVGLVEHYEEQELRAILHKMYSQVRPGGTLVVGIPNPNSLASLKARVLGSHFGRRFLSWVPGYRSDSEIPYSIERISKILREVTLQEPIVRFAGSSGLVGWSEKVLKFLHRFTKHSRFSFIALAGVQKL